MEIIEDVGTENYWKKRRQLILHNGPQVYTSLTRLIEDSKEPENVSLATFKPTKITGISWEEEREWKSGLKKNLQQQDLFREPDNYGNTEPVKKLPYKFFYKFEDQDGKPSRMMIEDWEIGALFWKCLERADHNEEIALQKVRQKLMDELASKCDLHFFVGTTKQFHQRRAKNPFVIIGLFYPPFDPQRNQQSLF